MREKPRSTQRSRLSSVRFSRCSNSYPNRISIYFLSQSEKDEGELLEESTRIRRLKLGAENQRREYAKEIMDLKDLLRQAQEQAELLRTEANDTQDLVDKAQNSVNGRQVHRESFRLNRKIVTMFVQHVLEKLSDTLQQVRGSSRAYRITASEPHYSTKPALYREKSSATS